jgi:TolB-like protein/Tfp pilus assembly protein PilF
MSGPRLTFGPFVLSSDAGTLLRDGVPVPLGHRGALLLAALVSRRGEVLTKADLLDAAWPDLTVEESNLTVQIASLRKLLGRAPDGVEWIATVPRVGYRFLAEAVVLPFTVIGDDPEQEAFADGLTEDLITDLSRNARLFVIARNSAFSYKGRSIDVRTVARDLGVRYVLDGSARRSADLMRINVQLVDAVGGVHLWAERFDRSMGEVFAVQDEVTGRIVEALVGRLTASPPRQRPKSLEAYDLCVRARRLVEVSPREGQEAHLLLKRAIALDPNYAEAHRWLAINRWIAWVHWGEPMEPNRKLAVELAERAVSLDRNDASCRSALGLVLAYERRYAEAEAQFSAALDLDPNLADAWNELSDLSVLSGRIEEGLQQIEKAYRLNPHPPSGYYWSLGQAQYAARDYEMAVATLRREETYRSGSRRFLAASLAQLGRLEEARQEAELFLLDNPHFTISHWVATQPVRDAGVLQHFVEGFRMAGLPE